jgi:hypothetical protein
LRGATNTKDKKIIMYGGVPTEDDIVQFSAYDGEKTYEVDREVLNAFRIKPLACKYIYRATTKARGKQVATLEEQYDDYIDASVLGFPMFAFELVEWVVLVVGFFNVRRVSSPILERAPDCWITVAPPPSGALQESIWIRTCSVKKKKKKKKDTQQRHLEMRAGQRSKSINVFVQCLDGKTATLQLASNGSTVADVKEAVRKRIKVPVRLQQLILRGQFLPLQDDVSLADCNITCGSTLIMTLAGGLCGGMGCGPSKPSAKEGGEDSHGFGSHDGKVVQNHAFRSDDHEGEPGTKKQVAKLMKGPPQVSEPVAVVIMKIMNKEPVFAAEVEAAKTAVGGATPAILKMAAEQAGAAVGTIYCMVVSLRRQWVESGGREGALPAEAPEPTYQPPQPSELKLCTIHPRLKAAEASLRSILSVILEEWKLEVGKASSSMEAFKKLPIAEAGPGVPTMLSEIGARVVAHHGGEYNATEWFTSSTTPETLSDVVEHFYAARNALVTTLVPAILTDVALYNKEAALQASAAGPDVLSRLAAVAANPNPTPLTLERIADLTGDNDDVPGSRTLARLSHDQMVACGGSIILYKRTSAAVASVAGQLSSPGIVLPGDVKGKERTIYKSALKYNGDTTKCHDKIRCTVELKTLEDVAVVAEALVELPEFLIFNVKNRFDPEYDALPIGGYRDMQFSGLIKLEGDDAGGGAYAWCEVQLNLTRRIA